MGTLARLTINNLVRSDLNEPTQTKLLDTELNAIITDGYRNVAILGLCNAITKTLTLSEGVKIYPIPETTEIAIRPLYVQHADKGLLSIFSQVVGHNDGAGLTTAIGTPRFWFPWGDLIVLEPAPNAAAVSATTKVHCACYPAVTLAADASLPTALPVEFHECVYDYALAFAALKLRRWGDASLAYNRYITNVQRKRYEYAMRFSDPKGLRDIPDNVNWEVKS